MGYIFQFVSTPYLLNPFIKFHPNVPLNKVVCRTNDSAMEFQTQGHTSGSWNLLLNFVSFKPLCQPFVKFSLNNTQMFLSVSWSAEPMTLLRKVKVTLQGHGIPWRGYGCPSNCCLFSLRFSRMNISLLYIRSREILQICSDAK